MKIFKKHAIKIVTAIACVATLGSLSAYDWDEPYVPKDAPDYEIYHEFHRNLDEDAPAVKYKAPKRVEASSNTATLYYPCHDDHCSLVRVDQSVPSSATVGEDYVMKLHVEALNDAADVKVRSWVPEGLRYVRSDPAAEVHGDQLCWRFDKMHKGDMKDIEVFLEPTGEGDFEVCSAIHAVPFACVSTHVGTPKLMIEKSGPASANLGDHVTYDIVVSNEGTEVARDVMIKDRADRGLRQSNGEQDKMIDVGDLSPGESRSYSVTMDAMERGEWCNYASASASNHATVRDEACTKVFVQGIEISKSGPATRYIGQSATYDISIRNTGDTDLTNVKVHDHAASATTVESAGGGDISGHHDASWNVGTLGAGQSKSFKVTLMSKDVGTFCNEATVNTAEGLHESAEACTEWKGHPAVLLEVVDDEDPLFIGGTTTYHIQVTNQGSANDNNISIKAMLPSQLKAVKAWGETAGKIMGNTIEFAPYAALKPGERIDFYVEAEAVGTGDARFKIELESELLKKPVTEEESTHIY